MLIPQDRQQKSPQKRFLFILRLAILLIYLGLGLVLIFFNKLLPIDPERFAVEYQIAFGVILIVYGLLRFGRLLKNND